MKALIFDTETTALIDNRTVKLNSQPHIIEFYGCVADLKSGKVEKELHHLIKPPIKIMKEITEITTIDDEAVKDAPPFAKVADDIFNFLQSEKIIIAHNLAFDKEIIEIEAERLGKTLQWPKKLICTVEQTISLKGFHLALANLHEHLFGKTFSGAHRANVDVEALLRCCVELYKREIL